MMLFSDINVEVQAHGPLSQLCPLSGCSPGQSSQAPAGAASTSSEPDAMESNESNEIPWKFHENQLDMTGMLLFYHGLVQYRF